MSTDYVVDVVKVAGSETLLSRQLCTHCSVRDVSVNPFLRNCVYNRRHIWTTFLIARSRVTNPCHRRRHDLANMELSHLFTRSGLTLPKVSLIVSHGFFCLFVCSYLLFAVINYGTFCLYVATSFFCIPIFCPKLWSYLILLQFLCSIIQVYSAVFLPYLISAAVILASLALVVQFSLPYNTTGGASVLCNFTLVLFKVFCGLNTCCSYCVLFSNSYSICFECPLPFRKTSDFLSPFYNNCPC